MIERGTLTVNGHTSPVERDSSGTVSTGPDVAKRAANAAEIAVLRVDRSPMNGRRWALTLACGHEEWITSARKPTRKTARCSKCASTG
jgi:predicted aminopeptidase